MQNQENRGTLNMVKNAALLMGLALLAMVLLIGVEANYGRFVLGKQVDGYGSPPGKDDHGHGSPPPTDNHGYGSSPGKITKGMDMGPGEMTMDLTRGKMIMGTDLAQGRTITDLDQARIIMDIDLAQTIMGMDMAQMVTDSELARVYLASRLDKLDGEFGLCRLVFGILGLVHGGGLKMENTHMAILKVKTKLLPLLGLVLQLIHEQIET
ncbi:hypothetical protein L6164_003191 [Bauhinia variegata]|uniref:Uncharacterized protein n=1 Tax=Bauhinia variegata TaxID=167791 RepID=A0ACB9Q627_BAUVA|nr:hypothetical protein L6164_003191 [Bauhinia variegata]